MKIAKVGDTYLIANIDTLVDTIGIISTNVHHTISTPLVLLLLCALNFTVALVFCNIYCYGGRFW